MLEAVKEKMILRIASEKLNEKYSPNGNSRGKSIGEVLIQQHMEDPSFDMDEVNEQVIGLVFGVRSISIYFFHNNVRDKLSQQ